MCSVKKLFLKISQNSQENTCVGASFIKKETQTQVFFCEFCEIFKNTFFSRTTLVATTKEEHQAKTEIIDNTDKSIPEVKRLYKNNNKITHDLIQKLKKNINQVLHNNVNLSQNRINSTSYK